MSLRTITETDLQGKGNTGQPDVPNLSVADMQHKLDELSLDVIIPIFNLLVGQLEAKEASADLGATVDDDYTFQLSGTSLEEDADTKIQTLINTILKECETLDINLYDLATIFAGISQVASSVSDDPTAIPTSRAIVNYVSMLGGGDMMKTTYDSNNDGVVNDSDKLGGELPSYYQKATDTDLETTDQTTTGAINEVLGAVEDVADDLSDFANTYDESAGGSTIETIGSGAKGSYGVGDLFVADDHFYYKAIAIISPGNILSIANCTNTNTKAELNAINTALINKVSKFVGGGYVPVDSIAYDETNKKLGLKVNGADTVIPFKKGSYAYAELTCYPNSSGFPLDLYDDSGVKIGGSPAVGTQFSNSQDLYEDMLFRAYLNYINASASTIRFYAKEPIKVNDTPVSVGNYVEYNWKSNIKAKVEPA